MIEPREVQGTVQLFGLTSGGKASLGGIRDRIPKRTSDKEGTSMTRRPSVGGALPRGSGLKTILALPKQTPRH